MRLRRITRQHKNRFSISLVFPSGDMNCIISINIQCFIGVWKPNECHGLKSHFKLCSWNPIMVRGMAHPLYSTERVMGCIQTWIIMSLSTSINVTNIHYTCFVAYIMGLWWYKDGQLKSSQVAIKKLPFALMLTPLDQSNGLNYISLSNIYPRSIQPLAKWSMGNVSLLLCVHYTYLEQLHSD